MALSLPVLAFQEFGGSSPRRRRLLRSVRRGRGRRQRHRREDRPEVRPGPARRVALVGLALPLPLLALHLPVWGVVLVLFVSSLFGPLVNAPLIGVITMRTPEALRAKVMTAVLTFALLAGPLGLFLGGPLLAGVRPVPRLPDRRGRPARRRDPASP